MALGLKKENLPRPPRANDLSDHYGTNPSANMYGPVSPILHGGDLMRQGMLSGIPITPIKNFDQEVVPSEVVAGNFLKHCTRCFKNYETYTCWYTIFIIIFSSKG